MRAFREVLAGALDPHCPLDAATMEEHLADAISLVWSAGAEVGRDVYAIRRLGFTEREADRDRIRAMLAHAMRSPLRDLEEADHDHA